jgi:ankyrin repeat protein
MDDLLWHISASGNTNGFNTLIETAFNLNIHNQASFSPLQNACHNGYTHCVKLFLEHGANPNRIDDLGSTPLNIACWYGHFDCVQLLLDFGAEVDLSALEYAERRGHLNIVTLLHQYELPTIKEPDQ